MAAEFCSAQCIMNNIPFSDRFSRQKKVKTMRKGDEISLGLSRSRTRDLSHPKLESGQQANRPTGQQANRPTGRQANRPTGQQANRPTGRQAKRPTGPQADRPTGRQADRPTGQLPTVQSGVENRDKAYSLHRHFENPNKRPPFC